jgi:2-C-methyl-D-erythritol 2,4-cyclodiphosphate synthase
MTSSSPSASFDPLQPADCQQPASERPKPDAGVLPAIRIGQGYDLHRLVEGASLFLGGIAIESPLGTLAHSDGDVLLHALIDALLGACALGDIGTHFPPSDPQYRNMASRLMVQAVIPLIQTAGYGIVQVDSTIFLESPKLFASKPLIQQSMATLLHLPVQRVSVKAKTAEGLPPVGTHEAIAASATVLLEKLS